MGVVLSIIIPVYNSKKHLDECLKSICTSSKRSFEVIMVDDGSNDGSTEICIDYCAKDNRFRLLRKRNGGASSARNYGMKKASGQNIMFVDSDDVLLEGWDKIMDSLAEYDIYYYCNNIKKDIDRKILLSYITGANEDSICLSAPFSKVFSSSFLKKNHLEFNEKLINGEDMLFNVSAILAANTFTIINYQFYLYRQETGQATRRFDERIIESDRVFHKELHDVFSEMNYDKKVAYEIERYCLVNAIALILNRLSFADTYSAAKNYYLELEKEPYREIIDFGEFSHSKIVSYLCKKHKYEELYRMFRIRNHLIIFVKKMLKKKYNRI